MSGGGGFDTIYGGEGMDSIHAGAGDMVDGGAGFDDLLPNAAQLDISSLTMTNIECVRLLWEGKELTVSGDAIVKNGVADPAGSGHMALMVFGDENDTVYFSGDGWTWTLLDGDHILSDSNTYRLYEGVKDGQTALLYVETSVGVDLGGNDAPVGILLMDDDDAQPPSAHLQVTDDTADAADLEYSVTHSPVQVWGTNNADDLTAVADFDQEGATFHVYGLGGDDTLRGGSGDDALDGGTGCDMIDYSASATWVSVDLNQVTAQIGGGDGNHALGDTLGSIERVIGTSDATHGDVLTGDGASNVLSGLDGDDTLYGGGFYDTIYGGDGHDWIDGGADEDVIYGGAGNDTLIGGADYDTLYGGAGDDSLYGGSDDNDDMLVGGAGNDTLEGGSGADILVGGMGADRIIGNGVSSLASYELSGYADYELNYQGVHVDLRLQGPDEDGNLLVQPGKPGGDDATGDILTGIVHVVGSNGADTLIGNHQANVMHGVGGNDFMIGGEGNDTLSGGDGDNTMEGGLGADVMQGDMGYDIASYANAASGVNVSLDIQDGGLQSGTGEENGDQLKYMDGLFGSGFNDTLTGCGSLEMPGFMSLDNRIEGRGGDDVISGLAGNDTLDGGTGNDTLMGGTGNDLLLGGDGDDLIYAGAGDTVDGGAGFDAFRLEDNAAAGSELDLSAMIAAGRITGIAAIDITGDADDANTLTLKASDVLNTTGGVDTLWVRGDGNDSVATTDFGWQLVGVETGTDGQQYNHYSGYAGTTLVNLMIDAETAQQNVVHA
jgi:Ca2+-binding RTX toxin-like protein